MSVTTAIDPIQVVDLPKRPSEQEVAADLKRRLDEASRPMLAIMDEAIRSGLTIQFDGIQCNAFGKHQISGLRIVKIVA